MNISRILCSLAALALAGCGLRGYHFASYGPGDTSAGDVTHATEAGARVVVPNTPPDPPQNSYEKPTNNRGATPRRRPSKKTCGTERWAVKTLADPEGEAIAALTPMPNTVHGLASLTAPSEPELKRAARRFPPERNVYRVSALVLGAKQEPDQDFHLVLADPAEPASTLVAEIPSGACVRPARAKFFRELRAAFTASFLAPEAEHLAKLPQAKPACVTGVGFFDFLHGQTGAAVNGIELHPVVGLEPGFCR
ncbi:MAG: hypothetical protein E6H00_13060 [Bacillati bacterium ANGP1]|uniref:Lipoprotein n=1 Tax=Candidatus Segetimicrobium genomatis TaxID=2569760 RepID=A0A537JXT8_9BACT|nr:MAG: hypothetical protein E6H00_13060 [Terrabacteria group bacterium ANGP1]